MSTFRHLFLSVLALLALTSSSVIPEIVLKPKSPEGKLALNDLVESVEYLPLETKNNCLIGGIGRYDISENYILVYCGQTKSVYLFRRDGHFIKQISHQGQGPEEYLQLQGVLIDESNKELILCSFNKHLFYSFSGKFLRAVSHQTSQTPLWIYSDNKLLSGTPSGVFPGLFCVYNVWTKEMKLESAWVQSIPLEHKVDGGVIMTVSPPICSYVYEGKPHTRESALNDTVYMMSDNKMRPKYILNTGQYGITAEGKASFNLDLLDKSVSVVSIAETSKYILFRYLYKKKNYCAYYTKESGKLEYFETKEEGIPNNYNGGIDFWPTKQINNEWYCFYSASDLLERSSKHKTISPIVSSASSKKYNSLVKQLDAEDNPVLVISRIK